MIRLIQLRKIDRNKKGYKTTFHLVPISLFTLYLQLGPYLNRIYFILSQFYLFAKRKHKVKFPRNVILWRKRNSLLLNPILVKNTS